MRQRSSVGEEQLKLICHCTKKKILNILTTRAAGGAEGDLIAMMMGGEPGKESGRAEGADKAEMQTFLRFLKFLLSLPFPRHKIHLCCATISSENAKL